MSNADGLRVALVSARFLPNLGGTEVHVAELASRLVAAGVETEVVTTGDGVTPDPAGPMAYRVTRVRAIPSRGDLYFAPGLVRHLVASRFDLIHVQGVHTLFAPMAMASAIRANLPYVVTFHTGGHRSSLRNRMRRFQWRALAPLLRRAAGLIAVSEFERALFSSTARIQRRRISVIPNGAGLPLVDEVAEEEDLIVSVGRLERYKGHDRAIEALRSLVERRPSVRLLILGSGEDGPRLRTLADRLGVADRVEIRAVPANERATMASHVASAALVVLLSEYEAHPVAIAEALGLGRRVLVADTSGLSEIARAGSATAVPLSASPDAVADAIDRVLRSPPAARGMSLPTWDECAAAVLDVYRSAVRRAS